MWGAFLQCWVGLPPAVLGPSVLSKGVEIGPIATHFGPACTQIMSRLPRIRSHAHGRRSYFG